MKEKQCLNGLWDYRIGAGEFSPINVPFSRLPVGHSEVKRSFDLERKSEKVFLIFDGITYAAKVILNGKTVGEMLPYSVYKFDVTELVRDKDNSLLVELEDIEPEFGPTLGWENFGGIIRDVYLEYKHNLYIEDVFAYSTLTDNYTAAELTVETKATGDGEWEISLSRFGEEVLSKKKTGNEKETYKISNIALWSPDEPNLYQLKVCLLENGERVDEYECNIGFREIKCDKDRFIINGEPMFIKGVCKHEMFGNSGHCPTPEQIEYDLKLIKETGCNFVRLVHYPHHKITLDIADRIGLFVSEEPGLWNSDTANPALASGSIEVLKRTIMRDRNHPSIAFWLCFNECIFTEKFLVDSAAVCREYDPTRLVSGANCMTDEETKKYYNICGFDFYTMHPYWPTPERLKKSAEYLDDKPLLFTEWGGHDVYKNIKLLSEFMMEMNNLYCFPSEKGHLAGAIFWGWAEVNDFNRGKPACIDGNLCEGLVDQQRNPTLIYNTFKECIRKTGVPEPKDPFWFNEVGCIQAGENLLEGIVGADFGAYMKEVYVREQDTEELRFRVLPVGPVLENVAGLLNTPVLISNNTEINVSAGKEGNIELVGLTSIDKGYPLGYNYGEMVAEVELEYACGEKEIIPLRNGIEVTTVFTLNGSGRINPVAEKAKRVLEFGYEKNFEQYIMNSLKVVSGGEVKNIKIKSSNNGYTLLLYRISIN